MTLKDDFAEIRRLAEFVGIEATELDVFMNGTSNLLAALERIEKRLAELEAQNTYSRDQDVRLLEDALAAGKDVCARVSEGPYSNEWLDALAALDRIVAGSRSLEEQFDALKLAATRQLTPLDVAATHIDILRRNSESYDAKGRDNVALIVENAVNEARKALFDAISNPASTPDVQKGGTDA